MIVSTAADVGIRLLAIVLFVLAASSACSADDAAEGDAATQQATSQTVPAAATDEEAGGPEPAEETSEPDTTVAGEPELAPPAIDDLPWEVRPYRVLISVALADRQVMSDAFAERLTQSLRQSLAGAVGPYWQPTIEINDWLFPQTSAELGRLSAESLGERYQSTDHEKVVAIVLESDGPLLRLTGCEWDRSTATRGPLKSRTIVDRRRVGSVTVGLLLDLFRPLARIDLAEGTFAELRARGGELLSPESPVFPLRSGDLLSGHFRYLDRDRQVRRIQPVPWTYLRIEGIARSRMTASIETAFAAPLSGSRRRVELVAIRVEPGYPQTTLSLTPRTNPGKPLVGVRVRVYEQLPTEDNPQPEQLDLMTDRFGTVTVPAYPNAPLRRLIVHSGGAVLSNVPFVPGVEEAVSMELPDDSPRLQVEGSLAMVQGDLIDLVARRAVMMSRAVSLAKQEKFEESDKLLAEIEAQPSIASFESRILAIRVPAVDQARANGDRSQEKRIRMMCSDLEDLVRKYLDREKVRVVKEEVDELKKLYGT